MNKMVQEEISVISGVRVWNLSAAKFYITENVNVTNMNDLLIDILGFFWLLKISEHLKTWHAKDLYHQ